MNANKFSIYRLLCNTSAPFFHCELLFLIKAMGGPEGPWGTFCGAGSFRAAVKGEKAFAPYFC